MVRKSLFTAALTGAALAATAPAAHAGPDEYMGEIVTVAFDFCPRGTMEADGRLLPISEHAALFSLLGASYGGDGRTNFALPDLRERTPVDEATQQAYTGLTRCVVTMGIYPSRN